MFSICLHPSILSLRFLESYRIFVAGWFLVVLSPGICFAFESWEHKQLGDLAYHVALHLHSCGKVQCDNGDTQVETMSKRTRLRDIVVPMKDLACLDGGNACKVPDGGVSGVNTKTWTVSEKKDDFRRWPVSYGDIIMCVDYYATPEKFLVGSDNDLIPLVSGGARVGGNLAPDEPVYGAKGMFRSWRDLNVNEHTRCKYSMAAAAIQAAHINHAHFQSELVGSQRIFHSLAISESGFVKTDNSPSGRGDRVGDLFFPFAINAVSDHYLHDFFAPGHVFSWRSKLTDVAANAYHDRINRKGMSVSLDRCWFKYENAQLPTVKKSGGDCGSNNQGYDWINRILDGFETDPRMAVWFFDNSCDPARRDGGDEEGAYRCEPVLGGEQKGGQPERVLRLKQWVVRLASGRGAGSSLDLTLRLHGDEMLWHVNEDADLQRLVMLLVEVRSLLDVFDSAKLGPVDSFRNHAKWRWVRSDRKFFGALTATIGPVSYNICYEKDPLCLEEFSLTRAHEDQEGEGSKNGAADSPRARINDMESSLASSGDPIVGLGLSNEFMSFGMGNSRSSFQAEALMMGGAASGRVGGNWFLSGGVVGFREGGHIQPGIMVRPGFVIPELEPTLSFPIRLLKHDNGKAGGAWRPSIGIRFDQGFSSFLSIYLQASRDYAVGSDGTLRSGASYGLGVQIGSGMCRVPFLKFGPACEPFK